MKKSYCAFVFFVSLSATAGLPRIQAQLTFAPYVPSPITRTTPALVQANLTATVDTQSLDPDYQYTFWGFNNHVPGPFIRTRVGDVLEVHLTNHDTSGMEHNIDFHAVTGPGGGAPLLTAPPGKTKVARFKLLHPGLYIYHCAAPPIPMHIANGMYGLLLVEPARRLPKVDKEFYILQSEFYTEEPQPNSNKLEFSYTDGLHEQPHYVVFNGRVGAMIDKQALQVKTGERVRLYFGNAGPNLVSSFHVIGTVLSSVYREGDLLSPPAQNIQTTLVPAGGATVVDFEAIVPGNYTMVDHSIFRIQKGAIGFIHATGAARPDLYYSEEPAAPCKACKVHP